MKQIIYIISLLSVFFIRAYWDSRIFSNPQYRHLDRLTKRGMVNFRTFLCSLPLIGILALLHTLFGWS